MIPKRPAGSVFQALEGRGHGGLQTSRRRWTGEPIGLQAVPNAGEECRESGKTKRVVLEHGEALQMFEPKRQRFGYV